jgi:hypothetical protein
MEFLCKFCGRREGEPRDWLIAFELTKPGSDVKNTIFLTDAWDQGKALQENALHFCSQQCQDKFLMKWREHLAA